MSKHNRDRRRRTNGANSVDTKDTRTTPKLKTFIEVIASNPPRLVILFQRGEDGSERFQWGTEGRMPVLTLIGKIVTVQSDLMFRDSEPCDQLALVITWDDEDKCCHSFVHKDIPVVPLIGMLDTVKAALVDSRLAQHMTSQQMRIVGPDGNPMRR